MLLLSFKLVGAAYADQPISMIKTLCIEEPSAGYFSLEAAKFNYLSAFIHYGSRSGLKSEEDRIDFLKSKGLILSKEFSHSCKVGEKSYKVFGKRPPMKEKGVCGGDPRISITLQQGNSTLLDGVYFEPSCFSDTDQENSYPFIDAILIEESTSGGENVSVEVSAKKETKLLQLSSVKGALTQDRLDCLVQEGFLSSKNENQIFHKCID